MELRNSSRNPIDKDNPTRTEKSVKSEAGGYNAHVWLGELRNRIRVTDTFIVVVAVFAAQIARFGAQDNAIEVVGHVTNYTVVSLLLAGLWVASLWITQSTDERILGEGAAEYGRVLHASFGLFGILSIFALLFKAPIARGYLAVALPLGLCGILISRWVWRRHLDAQRANGRFRRRVIVLGGSTLNELLEILLSGKRTGWNVVGICRTDGKWSVEGMGVGLEDIPMVGTWREVRRLVQLCNADTVAVSGADSIGLTGMRELSWDLEGLDVDLLVAPGVLDVAGPRMHMRPVAGLPLLHIDKPRYEGANNLWKNLVDKLGALLLLALMSPVLIWCAILIKLTSPGPVLYRSERIGLNNKPFGMVKFRSMVPGADKLRGDLADANEVEGGVLFKMKDDPRVTPVGRMLRRYSLDELPQLFNVLKGEMSLIGPRPPLREEVEQYSGLVARRMLVRPGMTGLWQVSGRSNLSWEESVRLDLSYVENWSLVQDIQILWRTARAVLRSEGAY